MSKERSFFCGNRKEPSLHPPFKNRGFNGQNSCRVVCTGVSTYNVSPQQAGAYFNKIQCFCFEEQKLRPGEKIDMPVFFYVDPEFATDPKMREINHLTLSYTFFKVDEEDFVEAA